MRDGRYSIVFLLLLIVALFLPSTVCADGKIYVYTDSHGVVRFSSKPPPAGVEARIFEGRKSGFSWYRGGKRPPARLFKHRYSTVIHSVAREYGVKTSLIRAVIHVESAFDPAAVSPKGALGLMQIMPFHLQSLGIEDPFEPSQNIQGGVKLLSKLLKQYDGDTKIMLAAYNAGENAVKKFNGIPPFSETQNYIRKVLQLQSLYAEAGA